MNDVDNILPMDENRFWDLVSLASKDVKDFERSVQELSQEDMIAFVWKFDELAGEISDATYYSRFISEDHLEDLCAYVIGKGREFYQKVRCDPNFMPDDVDYSKPGIEIRHVVWNTYLTRFSEPMPPL